MLWDLCLYQTSSEGSHQLSAWSGKCYMCLSQTLEKTKGIEVLKEACAACGEAIAVRKGRMTVKDEARVVRFLLLIPEFASPATTSYACQ